LEEGFVIPFLQHFHPFTQTTIATGFTWGMTALGASLVFLGREPSKKVLDVMLAFAAGAMIFVVVEEVVPKSQRSGNTDLATLGTMMGFAVMMLLDVALG
jgi:zinc transporter ZupT